MRILTTLCLLLLLPATANADQANRRISVTGQAQISAKPDIAVISLGVESMAKTAAYVLAANSAIIEGVF
jgi:hypothetical protein